MASSSPNIRNSPWNSADTLAFLTHTYWAHFLHRGANPSELDTTHGTGFDPDSIHQEKPRNQTVQTLHTTPHGERVGPSPKSSSTLKRHMSASTMASSQHIDSEGFLPTQTSKLEQVTPTTQGPEKTITMTISFGTSVATVPVDHLKSNRREMRPKSGHISVWNYIFASIFTWILLAGFLVLPSSFSELESIETNSGELRKVLQAIRNLPLYVPSPPHLSPFEP